MKSVLGWLSDPSLHIVLLGMVLLYCAMGSLAEESIEVASQPIPCACYTHPEGRHSHSHHVSVVAKTAREPRGMIPDHGERLGSHRDVARMEWSHRRDRGQRRIRPDAQPLEVVAGVVAVFAGAGGFGLEPPPKILSH